ncbi:uncharacterized protein THITE_2147584 [Thermothielavioides terrestris NRRL 8126]|uniref:Uncharacterized protein n=1 Tax=Thermothielavioides terrestris (strain ATCC 38088 / NRRL 8126) TaxID=578455 RepID=G2RDV9_THETT|nr:uncharacterized protein THITE_2147584 [Thermothielavioides terrestris NRRL 8126]AEO70842.1 hypothetical protein THITE_2147584 [Thermothielavioides terrestris NRRL 8126]
MAPTVVLITGANRGIGRGLLQRFLALPDHTVIAGNRNPAHPSSQSLAELPRGPGSKLIVVKIDATVEQDPFDAVKELQEKHGIEYLDIVIPNAGVSFAWPKVADVKLDDLRAHMAPNVFGFLTLYQATRPLLQKSTREPIFAPIGSTAGVLARQPPITNGTYGPTKAVVNWYTIRINAEEPWLNAFVMDPGWVQTDLGNAGAQYFGLPQAYTTLDDSCDGMMRVFAETSKEKHGGKMAQFDGNIWEW